jgi:hypothetical protein
MSFFKKYFSKVRHVKIFRGYLIIIITYVLIVLSYVIFFIVFKEWSIAKLDSVFGSSFGVSFSASLLDDLVIFIVLGLSASIVSTLLSTKEPEENSFETRLKALANSENISIDDRLYLFLKKNVSIFLAYNKITKITFTIKEHNQEKGAYYIYVSIDTLITNMCKDNAFEVSEAKVFVEPDVEVNGIFGIIAELKTYHTKTGETLKEIVSQEKIRNKFEQCIQIEVPKNEELGIVLKYLIWSQTGDDKLNDKLWHFIGVQRYTRSIVIKVINEMECKRPIKYDLRYFNSEKKDLTLITEGDEIAYKSYKTLDNKLEMYPNDRLELFIHQPKKEDYHENI